MQIKINLKIFIFIIIFLITNQIKIYAYLMLFAFIHELGHLYMGLLLGLKPKSLKIMPFGVSILFETYKTKKQTQTKKMFIAIAGPVVNIIIAIEMIVHILMVQSLNAQKERKRIKRFILLLLLVWCFLQQFQSSECFNLPFWLK